MTARRRPPRKPRPAARRRTGRTPRRIRRAWTRRIRRAVRRRLRATARHITKRINRRRAHSAAHRREIERARATAGPLAPRSITGTPRPARNTSAPTAAARPAAPMKQRVKRTKDGKFNGSTKGGGKKTAARKTTNTLTPEARKAAQTQRLLAAGDKRVVRIQAAQARRYTALPPMPPNEDPEIRALRTRLHRLVREVEQAQARRADVERGGDRAQAMREWDRVTALTHAMLEAKAALDEHTQAHQHGH